MLLNTSFNIKGEPIVETFDDAINVFLNSKIDALYLPEISKIILK
jgi:carbamoyltransferase